MRDPCLLLAALALTTPAIAAAKADAPKPIETLARTAKWNMHYANNACYLYGQFGEGADQVILRFTGIASERYPRFALFGQRFARLDGTEIGASIYYLPATGKPPSFTVTSGSVTTATGKTSGVFPNAARLKKEADQSATRTGLPQTPEELRAITALRVEVSGVPPFELQLQSMDVTMAAMRKCTDNLVRSWGFDPDLLATLKDRSTPTNDPADWARTSDYPMEMMMHAQSASVEYRLNIDPTGRITDCVVQDSTTPPEIGPHTCALIRRRARFTPAHDKDGNPVADFYISRVNWIIPDR